MCLWAYVCLTFFWRYVSCTFDCSYTFDVDARICMAKNTGKKPLSRAMSGKWQLKLFCNVRHWSRFQLGDLKCDAIKNSMDEYMTSLIHCCLKAGGWYKELTHFGVISLARARALCVYLSISSLRTPHPLSLSVWHTRARTHTHTHSLNWALIKPL